VQWRGLASEEDRVKAEPVALRSYFEEDLDRFSSMFRERRPVQPLSETTGGELDRSFRYSRVPEAPRVRSRSRWHLRR
jgi:hypothetical protein